MTSLNHANVPDLLDAAGLTGRGGAAFSTGVKVRAAHENGADLIVDACDGEPGAAKDGWVVTHHLAELVAGAQLVARAGNSRRIRYAAHRGSRTESLLRAAGLDVLAAPPRYVSSEESSLISLARGGLARPMTKRQPFVLGGRDGSGWRVPPTVVLNAETVWRVAQIAEYGPAWFRSFGTPEEPGPRLVTVTGHVASPRVVETQAGTSMTGLIDAAGGLAADVETVLIGGLAGVFVTAAEARDAAWSAASLDAFGGALGAGLIEVVDPSRCPLNDVGARLEFAQGESAGQCGPCMFGLPALASDWRDLVARPSREARDRVLGRADLLPNRGACRFPDGVAGLVRSAVRVHDTHLREHLAGPCDRSALTRTRRPEHAYSA